MSLSQGNLAERYGIESSYIAETGERRIVPEEVQRALLEAMEVDHGPASAAPVADAHAAPPCYLPDWLAAGRTWGLSVQLYGTRSLRNLGIGDFEDLARLGETAAAWGADFIGVNPLHALFSADPERASPYSPSSRQFLNPLYIAIDRVPGVVLTDAQRAAGRALRSTELVDYAGVAKLKCAVLGEAFAPLVDDPGFTAFCANEGEALHRFAVFEALSERFAPGGRGAGWQAWPEAMRDAGAAEVSAFAAQHAARVAYHKWLQWLAAQQLAEAQARVRAAGMRIGIYLDLAVAVSPDGAAAWSDPQLFAARARIGAPPDMFNHLGQDWGLAPMKPATLRARAYAPFEREVRSAMRAAGAVRLDHVMGLARLYWLPAGADAREGGYVRYPLQALLGVLGRCSREERCIVIGEDLGTVPPGFRDIMATHNVLSYRVLYFERGEAGRFIPPGNYPARALACVATHDLPPLRGWWQMDDVAARRACRIFENAEAEDNARAERAREKQQMAEALYESGVLDRGIDFAIDDPALPDDVFIAAHRYLARTPSGLIALQLEDLAGAVHMVNLPGTDRQHVNWRRKLPVSVEELPAVETLRRTVEAVAQERPRRA